MKNNNHSAVAELHEFVETQADEDAVLPIGERRHQAEIVADVLGQETSSPAILKQLLDEYSSRISAFNSPKQAVKA